jgi:thioesterase domain-containing protein/acyl carrier protein
VTDGAASIIEMPDRPRRLGAVVLGTGGGSVDADAIQKILARRLPAWEVPTEIVGVERIPTTRNGKVDRAEVSRILMAFSAESAARNSIPDWEVPARLSVVESIPRTASGKVDRRGIASIRGEESQDVDRLNPALVREAREIVIDSARVILDDDDIDGRTLITDLGADSLDLLQLAMELESRFMRPVTLAEILQASSLDEIVDGIVAGIKVEEQATVPLRCRHDGDTATFACIPGIGGTVFSYHEIFQRMETPIKAFGLPYPGLTGTVPPMRSIEEIADHFVSHINEEIGGVDFLVGYSLGGFVAFEIARRLARQGNAPLVISLGAAPSLLPSSRGIVKKLMSASDWKKRLEAVLPLGFLLNRESNTKTLEPIRMIVEAGLEAITKYEITPAPGVEMLFVPSADELQAWNDSAGGWASLVDSVRSVKFPYRHLEMFARGSKELSEIFDRMVTVGDFEEH